MEVFPCSQGEVNIMKNEKLAYTIEAIKEDLYQGHSVVVELGLKISEKEED